MQNKGCFIVFEGMDGVGKSCQMEKIRAWCEEKGLLTLLTREPGGCPLGQQLRETLLDKENKAIAPQTELLLYAADRAQHCAEVIRPALRQGKVVLCDRYTLSTLAYQGYGRGIDLATIKKLNEIATEGLMPDAVIVLDLLRNTAKERMAKGRNTAPDRIEEENDAFFNRVRQGYLAEAKKDPAITVIQGDQSREKVFADIKALLENIICTEN